MTARYVPFIKNGSVKTTFFQSPKAFYLRFRSNISSILLIDTGVLASKAGDYHLERLTNTLCPKNLPCLNNSKEAIIFGANAAAACSTSHSGSAEIGRSVQWLDIFLWNDNGAEI